MHMYLRTDIYLALRRSLVQSLRYHQGLCTLREAADSGVMTLFARVARTESATHTYVLTRLASQSISAAVECVQ